MLEMMLSGSTDRMPIALKERAIGRRMMQELMPSGSTGRITIAPRESESSWRCCKSSEHYIEQEFQSEGRSLREVCGRGLERLTLPMTLCSSSRVILVLFFLGTLLSKPAHGQQPNVVLQERVEVHLMLLDVGVLDDRGRPVGGLSGDLFRAEIDGLRANIAYVDEIVGANHTAVSKVDKTGPSLGGISSTEEKKVLVPTVPRYISLFLDVRDLSASGARRIRSSLDELFARFGEDDHVQLIEYTGDFRVVCPLTTSRERLKAALEKLNLLGTAGKQRANRKLWTLTQINTASGSRARAAIANDYARVVGVENRQLVAAVGRALRDLTGQPGRRALVLFTDGLELRPGEHMLEIAVGRYEMARYSTSDTSEEAIAELVRKANSVGVTLFSVQAEGLVRPDSIDVESGHLTPGPEMAVFGKENRTEALVVLAAETGGSALVDSNALTDGLGRIARELTNFYQIALRIPAGMKTDSYHQTRIWVEGRRDLVVHAPKGWADQAPDARTRNQVDAAFGAGRQFTDLTPTINITSTKAGGLFSSAEVTAVVKLPADQPTWRSAGEERSAILRLYIEAIDDNGWRSDLVEKVWEPRLSKAEKGAILQYEVRMKIRDGRSRLVVAVRDEESGRMGSVEASVQGR